MKKSIVLLGILGWLGCGSLKPTDIVLDEHLKTNTTTFKVKDNYFKAGGLKRPVLFGGYKTTNDKAKQFQFGIPKNIIGEFKSKTEKFSFQFVPPKGEKMSVNAISEFSEVKAENFKMIYSEVFSELNFEQHYNYKDSFVIYITPEGAEAKKWVGIIEYTDDTVLYSTAKKTNNGLLKGPNGEKIAVKVIKKLKGQAAIFNKMPGGRAYGMEFIKDDKVIGAVSLVSSGKVSLRNDLSETEKTVLGAVSAAVLKKRDQKFQNELGTSKPSL